jgi:hypothetical protein
MTNKPHTRASIRPVKERIEDKLLKIPGVGGVDISEKLTHGKPTGELSIVVYVGKKKPKSQLTPEETIPAQIEGIPTDVQEEKIVLQPSYQAVLEAEPQVDGTKYPTLKGGISMGPCRSVFLQPPDVPAPGNYIFTGTLGAIVKDRATGAKMALTNFHVACVDSTWAVGNTMAQPSRVDGGTCPADRFGTLTRATLSENVDGAVVTLDQGKANDCSIEGIGGVKGHTAAVLGSAVRKRGRTTELTHGTVDSTDVTLSIDYGDGLGLRTLKHQIRIKPDLAKNAKFSDHGDSGSVVVDANNKVIGLLFGGTNSGSATFANPIQKVLDELQVDLCVKSTLTLTSPVVCGPIQTQSIVCVISKPISCYFVSKPVICQIVTSPMYGCMIKTIAGCPPVSLQCGFDPRDLMPRWHGANGGSAENGDSSPIQQYGRPSDGENDAFWLGYYAALEAFDRSAAQDDESCGTCG